MSVASDFLDDSVAQALIASRIVGKRQSYATDNRVESAAVFSYLKGGTRPTTIATAMGKHLIALEDARRALYVTPVADANYNEGTYTGEVYGR